MYVFSTSILQNWVPGSFWNNGLPQLTLLWQLLNILDFSCSALFKYQVKMNNIQYTGEKDYFINISNVPFFNWDCWQPSQFARLINSLTDSNNQENYIFFNALLRKDKEYSPHPAQV